METKSKLQKKCDQALQAIGRLVYKRCLVCGGDYSCLHHYLKKSQSTALRYDWNNCIPLCHKCHSSIHIGLNDTVSGRIALIMGKEWLDDLIAKKRAGAGKNYGLVFYRGKLEELKELAAKLTQ